MNSEDKFFIVSYADGINVRSKSEVEKESDLGNFDLNYNDVIHAVAINESNNGTTFHNFDRIYRDGIRYDYPFDKFQNYMASPTGKYWAAEKDSTHIWMAETNNPELSMPKTGSESENEPQPPSGKKYVGWRVLHQAEGGYQHNPLNMPEVIPPENPVALEMTEPIQRLSFELMKHFNPAITAKQWTMAHHGLIAFTNYQGFGTEPKSGGPRANYITGDDLNKKLPKYDKAQRLCGGMFVRGIVRGDKLVCQPGIHGIDATKPMPKLDEVIAKNWYFFAVTLYNSPEKVGHFPQGKGGPVAIPFIFDREIQFSLSLFEKWESDTLPDPLKMYRIKK